MVILVTAEEPLFFQSEEEAINWIEAPDVEDGLYEAFDEYGHRLDLGVDYREPAARSWWRRVPHVSLTLPVDVDPEALQRDREYLMSRLEEFIALHGSAERGVYSGLRELILRAQAITSDQLVEWLRRRGHEPDRCVLLLAGRPRQWSKMNHKRVYIGAARLGIFYFSWPFARACISNESVHVSLAFGIVEHVVPLKGKPVRVLPILGHAIFIFEGGTLGRRQLKLEVLRGASEFEAELRASGADLHV